MGGPVVTIELVGYVTGSVTLAVGIVLWVSQRFSSIWRAFDAYRLHVAETYSTKAGQQDSTNRIMDALNRLSDRIDQMLGENHGNNNNRDKN